MSSREELRLQALRDQTQRYLSQPEEPEPGLTRIGPLDLRTGRYYQIHQDGTATPDGRKTFDSAHKVGQAVRRIAGSREAHLDGRPATKPRVAAVEPNPLTSAVPILFTRLNNDGDREFWLGGDRLNPVLLDTFPKLNLITDPWATVEGTVVAPAGPIIEVGTPPASYYQTYVSIGVPTFVLSRVTGSLFCTPGTNASTNGTAFAGFAASQIGSNNTVSVELTTDLITYTDTIGQVQTFPNRDGMVLLIGDRFIYVEANGHFADVTVEHEFIPCYLSAIADKRFVVLQPEPGVLAYYEINASNNNFTKTIFSSPGPVETRDKDWRSPLASFTSIDIPFTIGTPCSRPYFAEYGPILSGPATLVAQYGSNFVGNRLTRLDSEQGLDFQKLYFHYDETAEEYRHPLINTQSVQLNVQTSVTTVSGASCTIEAPITKTLTAKSLNTPDALILAIAPVIA